MAFIRFVKQVKSTVLKYCNFLLLLISTYVANAQYKAKIIDIPNSLKVNGCSSKLNDYFEILIYDIPNLAVFDMHCNLVYDDDVYFRRVLDLDQKIKDGIYNDMYISTTETKNGYYSRKFKFLNLNGYKVENFVQENTIQKIVISDRNIDIISISVKIEPDSDCDLVSDELDMCPNTVLGQEIDEYGCTKTEL